MKHGPTHYKFCKSTFVKMENLVIRESNINTHMTIKRNVMIPPPNKESANRKPEISFELQEIGRDIGPTYETCSRLGKASPQKHIELRSIEICGGRDRGVPDTHI